MMQAPGYWLTFFYYFAITNFIVLALVSRRFGVDFFDFSIYPIGIGSGLIAGILGSSINRNITISILVKRKATWLKTFNGTLEEMGFTLKQELEDFTIYKKSAMSTLFSGRVFLKFEGKHATIIGRAHVIQQLKESSLELE